MKSASEIPVGKLNRAGKILKTGLKVGKNYAAYYGERLLKREADRDELDSANAEDIIKSLQELKGGGLKVAQMLSMEENLLPQAYVEQFSLAQFSVPPLSAPLVKQTFKRHMGRPPEEIFDEFDYEASFAASIGQVHAATLNGKKLAVKVQYPGVADSIRSDLAMLKPMAGRLFRINLNDAQQYFDEVEAKLIEETDYDLELKQSQKVSACGKKFSSILFPEYYPELSCDRILTMDWIEGLHLSEYVKRKKPDQETRNRLGQELWDFFMQQIHSLRMVHADPHPGNILVTDDAQLAIIDFGCIKEIPEDFYEPYFRLQEEETLYDVAKMEHVLEELEILRPDDPEDERAYFLSLFSEILQHFLLPFREGTFDFGDPAYFKQLSELGERLSRQTLKYRYNPNRGSKHFIYMNRTFFGLYHLLHLLQARLDVNAVRQMHVST